MIKKLYITAWIFFIPFLTLCQSNYIGLRAESNVANDSINPLTLANYWPKFQLIDSVIYVPTVNGIYSKHLSTLQDTNWNNYAFTGVPIRDFIKKNNQIIGITMNMDDSLVVYSGDDGLSYSYRNDVHFRDTTFVPNGLNNIIHQIAHNSPSFDTILVSHRFGISLSTDTGNTWSLLVNYVPEYQYRFVDFNPANNQKLYSTGETGFFSSYVYASSDGGNSWNTIHSVFNDCVHTIAFHPSDENTYLIGREGRISKSIDAGVTWTTFNLNPYLYVYEIKYDVNDPNILYASGGVNGEFDTIYFLESQDAGNTWNILHQEIPGKGNVAQVLDFEILDDGIVYLTALGGLYFLDAAVLSLNGNLDKKAHLEIFPNPAAQSLKLKSDQIMNQLVLYDNLGKVLNQYFPNSTQYNINLENLENGIYYLQLFTNRGILIEKVIKE